MAAASLLLNSLVLFAVTRPLRACVLIVIHATTVVTLFAGSSASGSEAPYFTGFVALLLGPAFLGALEYYWHAVELEQGPVHHISPTVGATTSGISDALGAAPSDHAEPSFIGTLELQQLRNQLEIAIYHEKDRLATFTNVAYVVSALAILLAALEQRWLELSVAAILAGFAHTAQEHESRIFSLAYASAGLILSVRFAAYHALGLDVTGGFALPIGVLMIGFGLSRGVFTLARLRRIRSRIHLEPADHLRD